MILCEHFAFRFLNLVNKSIKHFSHWLFFSTGVGEINAKQRKTMKSFIHICFHTQRAVTDWLACYQSLGFINTTRQAITTRAMSLSAAACKWHVTESLSITIHALYSKVLAPIGSVLSLLPAPINKPNSHEIGQPLWREETIRCVAFSKANQHFLRWHHSAGVSEGSCQSLCERQDPRDRAACKYVRDALTDQDSLTCFLDSCVSVMSIQVSQRLDTCKCQMVHWAYLLEILVGGGRFNRRWEIKQGRSMINISLPIRRAFTFF